jgi:sugar lactone lactonase YvrE
MRRGFLALVGALVAVLLAAPNGLAATNLGTANFGDMVVDDAHRHVFVSGGGGSSSVFVLDYDGNLVETITGLSWPVGMALDSATSTLYVALNGGSGIAKIDTATLAVTGELSVAPLNGPKWLGLAGGRLWFSHNCAEADGGMSSIALDGSDLQTPDGADLPYYCPMFAPSPTNPNVMAVVDLGVSPSTVYVYDVSSSTPSLVVKKYDPAGGGWWVADLVISPDGAQLLGATSGGVAAFNLSDLARVRTYSTGGAGNSAAITADGQFVAAGRDYFEGSDIYVYNTATLTVARQFRFGGSNDRVHAGGLAFSPDKSRLFAVGTPGDGTLAFRAIASPTAVLRATSTSLAVSATKLKYKQTLKLTAHLTGTKTGTMSIYATPYGGTKTLVRSGSVNSYGNFAASYTMKQKTTFKAEYSGSDTHAASKSGGKTVAVYAIATVRMINYYGTSGKYRLYRAGTYPDAVGAVKPNHAGFNLKFVAQRYYAGAWRAAASDSFPLDWDSTFYAYLITTARGTYRMRTVFAGDADHLGDSSPWAYFQIR